MAAGDDDEIRGGVGLNFLEGLFVAGEDFLGHGKTLEIGEGLSVVDHTDSETGGAGNFGHGYGDVAAAEDIDDGLGENRLNKNFDRAAADESVVVGGFVVEIEDHFA